MGDAAEEYLNECYAAGDDLAAEGHPMTTERSAEETAIRAAVEKHCHCDTRWPATARIDDNNMQAFVTDLRAALADNSAAALTEARTEIERLKAALEPFALAMERAGAWPASACRDTDKLSPEHHLTAQQITFGDLRRARAAYQQQPNRDG